jgi:hypothetical protein
MFQDVKKKLDDNQTILESYFYKQKNDRGRRVK